MSSGLAGTIQSSRLRLRLRLRLELTLLLLPRPRRRLLLLLLLLIGRFRGLLLLIGSLSRSLLFIGRSFGLPLVAFLAFVLCGLRPTLRRRRDGRVLQRPERK